MRSTVRAKITDREIMQQALEALETANESDFWIKQESIVKALRERLAHCERCGKKLGGPDDIHTCSPQQPEQEPVAWRWKERINGDFDSWVISASEPPPYAIEQQPLYTAPPQRKPLTNKYRAYKK